MKSTGIVRKMDPLGRIVIPKELRKSLSVENGDPLEIFVEGEKIIFQKYNPRGQCMVTGNIETSNFKIGNGNITLSPEGAEILLKELAEKHSLELV